MIAKPEFRVIHSIPLSRFCSKFEADEKGRQMRAREIRQGAQETLVRWRIEGVGEDARLVVERAFPVVL